jgi:SNF2 family DNA or RNA helicase
VIIIEDVLACCKTGRVQVMLTSYETFRLNNEDIMALPWECIIFDEVHKIKNKDSKITQVLKTLALKRRYGLTGTVMQNSFEELWTLIDFISPGSLDTLQNFRNLYRYSGVSL